MTPIEIICRWCCEQERIDPDALEMPPLFEGGGFQNHVPSNMRTGNERRPNWERYHSAAAELARRLGEAG